MQMEAIPNSRPIPDRVEGKTPPANHDGTHKSGANFSIHAAHEVDRSYPKTRLMPRTTTCPTRCTISDIRVHDILPSKTPNRGRQEESSHRLGSVQEETLQGRRHRLRIRPYLGNHLQWNDPRRIPRPLRLPRLLAPVPRDHKMVCARD